MTTSSGQEARLTALGTELARIHGGLRAELDTLRSDVASFLDGSGARPRELRAHCLTFCDALTRHHAGEDAGAFPTLRAAAPELEDVLAKLEEDHQLISGIQHRLETLLDGIGEAPSEAEAGRVRGELDGLAAIMESHFTFEERRITAALNALPPQAGTPETLLGL